MNEQDNNTGFFRFENLKIYIRALEYMKWVHESFNQVSEMYQETVMAHFGKMAQSIALNIAEGSSRNKLQFINHLKMAKSAVCKCVVYTELAYTLGLYGEDDHEYSRTQLMELTKMIGSFIHSLQQKTSNTMRKSGEERSEEMYE